MRVLLITSRFLPHRGGLESVAYHLARELKRQGHEILIVTNRYPRTMPRHETIDDIPVIRLHFLLPSWNYLRNFRFDLFFAGLVYRFWTERELERIIHKFRPDVVNSHYLNEHAEFTGRCLAKNQPAIPWIVSLHGGDVDGEPLIDAAHMSRFRRIVLQASQLTSCSRFLADQAIHLEPSIREKVQVIHNGVDANLFAQARSSKKAAPYILAVGQLAYHKGFDVLVSAFAEVAEKYRNVNLVIAGEGAFRPNLERQINQKGLERRINLAGRVDSIEVADLMAGCKFVVLPSRRESFGIVALEGIAAGKRVMATPVGGLPEFLPCPPNQMLPLDATLWAEALDKWLGKDHFEDEELNLAVAQKYTWGIVADQYKKVYQRALAK